MGYMQTNNKANYYSDANVKQGWSVEIIYEFIKENSNILTPSQAKEIKTFIQPKETFQNPIENYDEQKVLDSFLDPIIMTNQETYGRGMTN